MRPTARVQIVPRDAGGPRSGRPWLWAVLVIVWLASLGGVWWMASRTAAPRLVEAEAGLQQAQRVQAEQRRQIEQLQQRQVNLAMSDKISRAANTEVQASLAERDEQIAALRADVAFYERLVGSTAQRKGLNAHSVQFTAEAGGTWNYSVVLTQNLNRGAISQGQLRFAVEGVRAGKLVTVSWNELHQKPDAVGQPYSFRYFQQLDGSVILPKDFTPQRVKISLSGDGAPVNQTFDWKVAGNGAGE
ncbi:hypothetical protein JH302_20135 [Xanthomonas campestris]|uniref:DUF6776 family protein n=1 Tax=Xanthomonas campestris TaxID=339 RepID=UPI000E0E9228|nr:DUF6776 family protein [Xanthomonas campestris]WDJ89450.1 hypothetical protein JH302_20135 [Xanthomonas campestris]